MTSPDPRLESRRKRLQFRAWHRGTKEADMIFGNFIDAHAGELTAEDMEWFEALLAEREHDILDWIYGKTDLPARYDTGWMAAIRKLDFIPASK